MRNHYIPQFYLNGFANHENRVCTYWKGDSSKKHFFTTTKNIALEKNFYPDDLEIYLSQNLEGPANKVLKKIRNQEVIEKNEKKALAKYIINVWKRVPQGINLAAELSSEVFKSTLDNIYDEFVFLKNRYPKNEALAANFDKFSNERKRIETDENYRKELIRDGWLSTLQLQVTPHAEQALNDMDWKILVAPRASFFTSDNPVFIFKKIGLIHVNSELTFPLSDDKCLWASQRGASQGYFRANKYQVKNINHRTMSIATKFLYFSSYEKWIENLANKSHLAVQRMNYNSQSQPYKSLLL